MFLYIKQSAGVSSPAAATPVFPGRPQQVSTTGHPSVRVFWCRPTINSDLIPSVSSLHKSDVLSSPLLLCRKLLQYYIQRLVSSLILCIYNILWPGYRQSTSTLLKRDQYVQWGWSVSLAFLSAPPPPPPPPLPSAPPPPTLARSYLRHRNDEMPQVADRLSKANTYLFETVLY